MIHELNLNQTHFELEKDEFCKNVPSICDKTYVVPDFMNTSGAAVTTSDKKGENHQDGLVMLMASEIISTTMKPKENDDNNSDDNKDDDNSGSQIKMSTVLAIIGLLGLASAI